MKTKKLLFLLMAVCLASGVKAQFYDSADDIYYYVQYKRDYKEGHFEGFGWDMKYVMTPKTANYSENDNNAEVVVFNFDGKKAAVLGRCKIPDVKYNLKNSSSYYEDKVETTEYGLNYVSSGSNTVYRGSTDSGNCFISYSFSYDRKTLIETYGRGNGEYSYRNYYKQVDKSFFKIGRSRTPSGTMHE